MKSEKVSMSDLSQVDTVSNESELSWGWGLLGLGCLNIKLLLWDSQLKYTSKSIGCYGETFEIFGFLA